MSALRCLEENLDFPEDSPCAGPVEYRWPGYGEKNWPRCQKHGDARVRREEEAMRRYPELEPADFDPSYAGERWDEDD